MRLRPLVFFLLAGALVVAPPARAQAAQLRLWDAAARGDTVELLRALADGGVVDSMDFGHSVNGRRALNYAALNNHPDAIRILLAHGAAIDSTSVTGFTALHHAAERCSLEAARALLAAGADAARPSADGEAPATRARRDGCVAVADLIEAAERGERPRP
jgi:ankyrin repeat protein